MLSPRMAGLARAGFREGMQVTSGNGSSARIAVIVALVAALALAGCGRKSGLDGPPGAISRPLEQPYQSQPAQPLPPEFQSAQPDPNNPDAKPVAPPPTAKRRVPVLDWLLE
jgi:predicted small lipoprotein YifL